MDKRLPVTELEYVGSTDHPALVAETDDYKVFASPLKDFTAAAERAGLGAVVWTVGRGDTCDL